MNIHKLTPPRGCPKCGYEGAFRGPRIMVLPGRMEWNCKVCGFVKVTAPLDVAMRDEEGGNEYNAASSASKEGTQNRMWSQAHRSHTGASIGEVRG